LVAMAELYNALAHALLDSWRPGMNPVCGQAVSSAFVTSDCDMSVMAMGGFIHFVPISKIGSGQDDGWQL
jgi:hypothetical protein